MEFIRKFGKLGKSDANIAGGKGASLGEMTQAGIPVPPGFVVLTDAFERFLEETDLDVEIDAALDAVDHREMHTVENASEKIQALILAAPMPADIAAAIQSEFGELGAEFVAVRSSATAEDSSAAAWAGQLDSFLNTTHETLLRNVQRCWASLFTPRAIFYRFEKGLHRQKISVAVVVQKMVASEVSGIAFSVHPVTQDRNQLIIEAGFGLGEAIVSGQITPDSYVVEKAPRRIVDVNVATQTRGLYRAAGGGNEWRDIPEPQASSQVLDEARILELSEIILRIERHYGFPCDIEWAFERGSFYVVQSRPITTLTGGAVQKAVEFHCNYSRDTTLFVQGLWAQGLAEQARARFGWTDPPAPFITHHVNDGVVEIWEHEAAIRWFLDRLLAANQDPAFLENLLADYLKLLAELKKIQARGPFARRDLDVYIDLVYRAAFAMTVFFYTGTDERMPASAQAIAVRAREAGDFFAENDAFARRSLANLHGLTEAQAGVMLAAEAQNPPTAAELDRRLHSFVVVDGRKPFTGTLEDFAAAHPQYRFPRAAVTTTNEVKGQCAFAGRVTGRVAVVRKQTDMKKATEGAILVAPMTTPDFMPAMKVAAAFVTDEGGVTCHAAIVAREMKKPCVIGTKVATQVLHDGDLVEVDAEKGIVRIIK